MNYFAAVEKAEAGGICIQPHVIPLGMAWKMVDSSDVDVVEEIHWDLVCKQTNLRLDESEIVWLEEQSPENRLRFLVEELGHTGVLLMVASTKQIGESDHCQYSESYAYLLDPDWAEVGVELGALIQRVLASWEDKDKAD